MFNDECSLRTLYSPDIAIGFHLANVFVYFSPHSVLKVSLTDPCFVVLQILMYDIRSNKPLLLKDHMYGLPIRNIAFHKGQDLVLSCDTRILKLWERETVSGGVLVFTTLAMVAVVFVVFTFLSFLSLCSLSKVSYSFYIDCCSPFSSHSFLVIPNKVFPLLPRSSLPPFPVHFLGI